MLLLFAYLIPSGIDTLSVALDRQMSVLRVLS